MDFRRLEIFLAVVEERGFTAAADRLGISQPAVSQAVRELEAELGTDLFHRLGRSVRLTPAGEALLGPARQTRRDIGIARAAVEEVAGLRGGRLDIACLPTLAVAPLASLVGAFRAKHAGVAIVLADPTDTATLLQMVESGRSEIGLAEEAHRDGLTTVPIGTQDFLVVLPPGSRHPDPFPLADLAGLALVAPPAGSSTRALLDQTLEAAAQPPRIAVEAAQREALLPLIAAGSGAGLLPRPLAEIGLRIGCVAVEPVPPVSRSIALVHRTGPLTPAARHFVELAATGVEPGERGETIQPAADSRAARARKPARQKPSL